MRVEITRSVRNPVPDAPYVIFEIVTQFTFSQRERELWQTYGLYTNTPVGHFLNTYVKRNEQGERTTIVALLDRQNTFSFGSVDEAIALEAGLRAMLVEMAAYIQRALAWETTTETVEVAWDSRPS